MLCFRTPRRTPWLLSARSASHFPRAVVSFSTTPLPTLPPWRVFEDRADNLPWQFDKKATNFANELRDPTLQPVELGEGLQLTRLKSTLPVYEMVEKPFLLTRKESRGLYDEVLRQMGVPLPGDKSPPKPADPMFKYALVLGNPGIGKSFGLFYAMQRLIRIDKLVFYHHMKMSVLYALVPPSMQSPDAKSDKYQVYSLERANEDEATAVAQLKTPETFYLFDPDEHSRPKIVNAFAIIATSPETERFKDYFKSLLHRQFFLSKLTKDELMVLVNPKYKLFDVDCKVVEERFDRVGGNLRAIMFTQNYEGECFRQDEKISQAQSMQPLIQAVMETPGLELHQRAVNVAQSSTLFAYDAHPPYSRKDMVVRVTSNYVKQQLLMKSYKAVYNQSVTDPQSWERFGEVALAYGGEFQVQELHRRSSPGRRRKGAVSAQKATKKVETLVISPASKVRLQVADLEVQWVELPFADSNTAPVVYTSSKPNFALVDAVSFRDRAYNFTIDASGSEQLPAAKTVATLLDRLQVSEDKPLRLYHCVPVHAFSEWCKSASPAFPGDNDQSVGKRIKQYVLLMPSAPPPRAGTASSS